MVMIFEGGFGTPPKKEKTTKEIAVALFISEKTVETHRGNLMLKLEARNIAGVVRKAIMLGLVEI